jgi:transposase InsO family protein
MLIRAGCRLGTGRGPERRPGAGRLNRALADRAIAPGIMHHSDRGVQYCSQAYVEKLQAHQFTISMSRTGNPYDNAKAESFMKTLKSEEVYLRQYRDQEDARASIQRFLEEVYNARRLHSALGYLPPAEFEQQRRPTRCTGGRRNEFSQAWGNLSVR